MRLSGTPARLATAILTFAALSAAPAAAQDTAAANPGAQAAPPRTPPRCTGAEYRQFDFWIGSWEVTNQAGARAGRNVIEPILDGCALQENWTGAGGSTGRSLNSYDRSTGRWHQTWVDASGSLLMIAGGLQPDGSMLMEGATTGPDGTALRNRIRWTPQDDGSVRQRWQQSSDGGETWRDLFDGVYRRAGR